MVDLCLCKDYKKRPSIQEILSKPIMQEKATYFCYPISSNPEPPVKQLPPKAVAQ